MALYTKALLPLEAISIKLENLFLCHHYYKNTCMFFYCQRAAQKIIFNHVRKISFVDITKKMLANQIRASETFIRSISIAPSSNEDS